MESNKTCEYCGKDFYVKQYRLKKARFCSNKCRAKVVMGCYKYWEGKHRYGSTNEKVSQSTMKEKHWRWNGYFKKDWEGYIFYYCPEHPKHNYRGLVRLHSYIVEKFIGRYLKDGEEVHHIDKIKNNNNLINLMLFSSKSAHRRFEMGGTYKPEEIIFDGRKLCQI